MNFENLLSIAESNKVNVKKLPKFGTELSAPKKEKKDKPKSETVRKLIEEKDRERREKEEYEKRKKREKEKRRMEEEKKNRFVIPKKKPDDSNSASPASSSHSNIDSVITGGINSRTSSPCLSSKAGDDKYLAKSGGEKHTVIKDKDRDRKSHSNERSKHRESSSSSRHHSSEKSDKTDRSSSDKMNHSHSKSDKHSKHKEDENRHKIHKSHKGESSHSSSKHNSESSSKHKHSSAQNESSKTSHSSLNASKSSSSLDKSSNFGNVSAKELTLEELRAQVKQMKQQAEEIDKPAANTSTVKSNVNPHLFEPHKNRHGIEVNEAEKRKAQILSKTQQILQRTKEKLAMAKEAERQPKKRLGKTSTGARKESESGQIKSKSLCKDDDSDEDEPVNLNFENSFNEEYLTQEPGSILKTIKSKIDEKLSSYNFPDKPLKERSPHKRKEKDRHKEKDKHKDRERHEKSIDKEKVKKQKHRLMEELKNEDRKELFGDRNNDSFHSGDDLNKNKIKKNKIVRRHQVQPPPMNFQDLLKLAESKSKEKVVEDPIVELSKPKKEERPMTQEERERLERQKESRRRARQEELELKKGNLPKDDNNRPGSNKAELNDRVNSWLADTKNSGFKQPPPEKDGSKLKAALTGNQNRPTVAGASKPGMISSKPSAFAKQNKTQEKEKTSKYDSENENVLSCKPSSSKSSRPLNPYMDQSTNPWDRITGHMKKSNPKPEKRKHEEMVSSEEEDEYDEDDDFIDDDDAGHDYSAHIRQIFGYDKRKYKDEDDDDDNMEAGFATIMKEEARSARIGLQEDLEDIRREEEELRQKKLAKMKKMRR